MASNQPPRAEDPAQVDVLIVGAGPAGLIAGIAAAQASCSVMICEQLPRSGAKLLATGGGRCNITNDQPIEAFISAYGRHGRFAEPALAELDPAALRELLAGLGLATTVEEGGGVYPASQKAVDVRAAFIGRLAELGVSPQVGSPVTQLLIENGRVVGAVAARREIRATCVILATGGMTYPELGGGSIGYELARQAGHDIVWPVPALVGLATVEHWPRACSGLSIPDAGIRIAMPGQPHKLTRGNLLFTHRGISGPMVLDMSGQISQLLVREGEGKTVPICLSFDGSRDAATWQQIFARWRQRDGAKQVGSLLGILLPRRLAEVVCQLANIAPHIPAAELSRLQMEELAKHLTATPVQIERTEGFAHAMVTRGGVSLKMVDPHTLASKLVAGLYFAGEVLDIDGPCGGYNLQWAFSSGMLAGKSAGSFASQTKA